jgi:hypothetical protein
VALDRVRWSHQLITSARIPQGDPAQQTLAVALQFAEPVGLQPIGQDTEQQVAGQVRGRAPSEHGMPSGPQLPDIETAQARDLVIEGLSIRLAWIDCHSHHWDQAARRRARREAECVLPLWTTR